MWEVNGLSKFALNGWRMQKTKKLSLAGLTATRFRGREAVSCEDERY